MNRYRFHANQALSNDKRKSYGYPHQGAREIARRLRRLLDGLAS